MFTIHSTIQFSDFESRSWRGQCIPASCKNSNPSRQGWLNSVPAVGGRTNLDRRSISLRDLQQAFCLTHILTAILNLLDERRTFFQCLNVQHFNIIWCHLLVSNKMQKTFPNQWCATWCDSATVMCHCDNVRLDVSLWQWCATSWRAAVTNCHSGDFASRRVGSVSCKGSK